ncbi:hypothetical protein MY11210_005054 [Beauveria gryllotalpidicola]
MSEKSSRKSSSPDLEATNRAITTGSSRWASIFGGKHVVVGSRIAPLPAYLKNDDADHSETASEILDRQLAAEDGAAIQYRTCSWQKTAALLFSEYICLAIMSFPWSYRYLGLIPGLILTVVVAALVLYTSLIMWKFCLRHPEIRDVCDLGQTLFWGKEWAWWGTAIMFILNNTFIQGLHVLVGAKYINTMTESDTIGGCRTVEFSILVTFICWIGSLPRTFEMMSKLGTASAAFTFISVLLAAIFAGIQSGPPAKAGSGDVVYDLFPNASVTFVQGMAAFLNISYTFIGQITLPSFIAEMRDPREFPKSLWACTIAEIIVFCVVGAVMYVFVGNNYMTAPAFGSLQDLYKKISFSFMIPTLIFLGCLYASVTCRFIFFRLFRNSRHISDHTVVGWGSWASILLITWIAAFLISQVIPFFSSLLSVMSSLFDSWFGFIFWGVAYFRMRQVDREDGRKENKILDLCSNILNVLIILIGVMFLTVGTYASVQGIIDSFEAHEVPGVFSCASNGV